MRSMARAILPGTSDPPTRDTLSLSILGRGTKVGAVVVLPPTDTDTEGLITQHKIWVSEDHETWTGPVAYGMWPITNRQRIITTDADKENPWIGIAELNIYGTLLHHSSCLGANSGFPNCALSPGAQEGSGMLALYPRGPMTYSIRPLRKDCW
ncbi:hypothetical protein N7516_005655 [Penicillium verrucosum]|uniref:uncharacterized protein n=1 Tax=Penicillium verrucosum TaxID=60171 RepID=UPI00254551BE|nr:uncharacterized protein N7516_005655 [Penicillium verrucosum]KAJ5945487.1 hypothetical protein N7516_005655 [Penicillium verrucosum]